MALIDIDSAREQLRVRGGSTINDDLLQRYIDAAIPVIEQMTGPIDTSTRTVTLDGGRNPIILPFGTTAVTSVTVNGDASTDWTFNSSEGVLYAGAAQRQTYFLPGRQNIVVEYTAGSDDPPANLQMAALELVRYWWINGQQPNRPGPQANGEALVMVAGYAVPPFVVQLCTPNMRPPGIG